MLDLPRLTVLGAEVDPVGPLGACTPLLREVTALHAQMKTKGTASSRVSWIVIV